MKKKGLLPGLAYNAIKKNSFTYVPYIGISIFVMFTFFVFDLIIHNDVMKTIPRAGYAFALMYIGFILLGIILVPFLFYTNSFLIKRRKKELGLYSILGMEKKHIGIMMLMETLMIYVVVVAGALLLGLIFSKAVFLLLLNLANLPVNAAFSISGRAIVDTVIFYAVISAVNLLANLIQVGKANPTELMSESMKGEKEPKYILVWTVAGILTLGYGYYLAVTSKVNNSIFTNFFLAVFLVVFGTYFLFTSGSIAFLKRMRANKGFYYRSSNFVSISGMIYRMKKNAASLVNICIFSTMVMITIICTVSLYLGIPGVQKLRYPYDIRVDFKKASLTDFKGWKNKQKTLARENGIGIEDDYAYENLPIKIVKHGNHIVKNDGTASDKYVYEMCFMTLDTFNGLESTSYRLGKGEVMIYSTGLDYGSNTIDFMGNTYHVKRKIARSILDPKENSYLMDTTYYIIVPDQKSMGAIVNPFGVALSNDLKLTVKMNLRGEEGNKQTFSKNLKKLSISNPGLDQFTDYQGDRLEMESMYGGLLFIGIFFGIIFMMCVLIIMYYKQITEGFEDQKNFEIMQKVGMSDLEVKKTIKKQILQVFFIPLAGAIIHTMVGMFMVIQLMAAIRFFQTGLIVACEAGVCILFSLVYGICYKRTARTYYTIVKRMQVMG
jgi:putative ABC transport system permease protein